MCKLEIEVEYPNPISSKTSIKPKASYLHCYRYSVLGGLVVQVESTLFDSLLSLADNEPTGLAAGRFLPAAAGSQTEDFPRAGNQHLNELQIQN